MSECGTRGCLGFGDSYPVVVAGARYEVLGEKRRL
jgi:hypothetical protein